MKSTIYYEAELGFPFNVEAAASFLAARGNGASTAIFENINEVPLNRANMIVGSIEATHKWFELMEWSIPESMTYPTVFNHNLYFWYGRTIIEMSLDEAMTNQPRPFFIKPKSLKQFTATIINKQERHSFSDQVPGDSRVYISDIVNFLSEYRVYVLDDKIVGCCNYNGDIFEYPDTTFIKRAVETYVNAPKFYSLDVGISDNGCTYIVECNDGYSLGNYGLAPKLYHRCLMARWREILEQNPVKL